MTLFQIIALVLIAVVITLVVSSWRRKRITGVAAAAWILLWSMAAGAVLMPDATSAVARAMSITRGADLVFYMYILGSAAGVFLLVLRIRKLEIALTAVVRELALVAESRGRGGEPPEPDAPATRSGDVPE